MNTKFDNNSVDFAIQNFLLSRESMGCTEGTMRNYVFNLKKFKEYLEKNGIEKIKDIKSSDIRGYLAEMAERGASDSYRHGHARTIRTLMLFCVEDKLIDIYPKFEMPKIHKTELTVLSVDEVKEIIDSCISFRDKVIILFCVDTGLRLSELVSLKWGDLNFKSGLLKVTGKGKKFRIVPTSASLRRQLLKYRSQLENNSDIDYIFQTKNNYRLSKWGLTSTFARIDDRSRIDFSAHALRRTFAKLSVKSGNDIVFIQNTMGHENIETTRHYIQALDEDDIIDNHKEHSVMENFFK